MCGRYASTQTDADLLDLFTAVEAVGEELAPSWNVAPTQPVRVVLERPARSAPDEPPRRQVRTARWGLVPSWAKDLSGGARLINARSETVTEKRSFRAAASRRRCVVPADGYYEWERRDGVKVPQFLHADAPLSLAGIYELWRDPGADDDDPARWVWSVAVLTAPATDALGHIHERTPVVLVPELLDPWLDSAVTDLADVRALLGSVPEPHLVPREVGPAVGNVANNGPELVAPV